MKKDPKTLVNFSFVVKTYYRDVQAGYDDQHTVTGTKTLKLFKSWFRLMKNRNRLLYGVVTFVDGEKWLWQKNTYVPRINNCVGGWKRAKKPKPVQLSLGI